MAFLEGINTANATLAEDRQERQTRLSNLIKGFELDNSGQYAPNEQGQTALDVQAKQLELKQQQLDTGLEYIKSMSNTKSMTDGILQLAKGNVQDGWNTIKQNPILTQTLKDKGVYNVAPVDWINDKKLWQDIKGVNISPEVLQDPIKRKALDSAFTKVMDKDGNWKLSSTESLIQRSNTLNYTDSQTAEGIRTRYNTIGQVLSGVIGNPLDEQTKDITSEATNIVAQRKLDDLQTYLANNPNATSAEITAYLNPPTYKEQLEKDLLTAKISKTEAETSKAKSELPVDSEVAMKFNTDIVTKDKFTNEDYKVATQLQGKDKMSAEERAATLGKVSVYKDTIALAEDLDKITNDDFKRNAGTNVQRILASVTGNGVLTKEQEKQLYQSIDMNTRTGMLISKYVKIMSGLAVTDSERKQLVDQINAGSWSTKEAMVASLTAFTEVLGRDTRSSLDVYAPMYQKTYIDMRNQLSTIQPRADRIITKLRNNKPTKQPMNEYKSKTPSVNTNPVRQSSTPTTKPTYGTEFLEVD